VGANEALARRLNEVTGQYDELNRRLQRIEPDAGLPKRASPPLMPPPLDPLDGVPRLPPALEPLDNVPRPFEMSAGPIDRPTMGPPQSAPSGISEIARLFPEDAARSEHAPPFLSRFLVGDYDFEQGSFVLVRPRDEQRVPFGLTMDIFTQARYSNFVKSANTWFDSAGRPQAIHDYSSVEVMRNFVQFSGFAIDPRLQFTAILFSSTAINDTVYLGWLNYRFNDALDVRAGNWLVPGTREWYTSFRYTLGADRLMATTFFRPNISPGIWAQGEPIEGLHYVAMFANSLNRFTRGVQSVGSSGAFGGSLWWEPWGRYGPGPSDIENHRAPTVRIGTSTALSREANQGLRTDQQLENPEDTILRLSDGTPLFRPGALAPGVQLVSTAVQLWAIDAAIKYRGFGLSGEYFFRRLDGFQHIGGRLPFGSIFDQGGLLQAGYFLVPGKLETFARTSFVAGRFGGGDEVGGGVNWYPRASRDWRLTFEVLYINHSPAENLLTGYRAGESGTLFQLQWFTDF
jgi:hypothetical protein